MLFDVHRNEWDAELLALLDVPLPLMPKVLPSSAHFGETAAPLLGAAVLIGGVAGDQQSALFGQACFTRRHGQEHLRHRLLHADAHGLEIPGLAPMAC